MTKLKQPLYGKTLIRFESFQEALVPRSKSFTHEQRECSRRLVNDLLNTQPASIIIKIKFFMLMIEAFEFFTHKDKDTVLKAFFDSPVPLLRKGFWGLNTLARLGVYGQTELHKELGYHLKSHPKTEVDQ